MSVPTPEKRPRLFKRIWSSRAGGKFRRNRIAVFALVAIFLYALLGIWIFSMEMIHKVGTGLEAWSLRERPVLGMLLPEATLDRVGPPNLRGFGLESDELRTKVQLTFFLSAFDNAIRGLDQMDDESKADLVTALSANSLGERRIADLPLEELMRIRNEAADAFDVSDSLVRRANAINGLNNLAEEVIEAFDTGVVTSDDEDVREGAALAMESLSYALEEIPDVDGLDHDLPEALNPEAVFDASDAIYAGDAEQLADTGIGRESMAALRAWVADDTVKLSGISGESLVPVQARVDELWPQPTGIEGLVYKFKTLLGTDRQGRSIMIRALYSAKVALQVGLITSLIAVIFGSFLGAAAAYFGGWVDHAVIWLYSVFSSIPNLVLLVVIAFMFTGMQRVENTLIPLYASFCMTFWIGPCRVIRGEVMKIKELEYVQAATALGLSRMTILRRHVVPNAAHLMFINFSLLFIGAIKGEVILTYLGLGVKNGASWGIMISQAGPEVINGFFWQIGSATFFMFVLVLAFNLFTDALQDALDPRHVD